ncbi:MAG: DUF4079 domain-containing protein [Cyanobacteria bacterium P01_A01_bin.105]
MDLPSFLWLWRIAAWSMGLSITLFGLLTLTGGGLWYGRSQQQRPVWLRPLHYSLGGGLVFLILLLLSVGVVGTLGEYGHLGHSWHLPAGLMVVGLVITSAWSATRIHPQRPWARPLHLGLNASLLLALAWVSYTGWSVVQKYLP